MKKKILVLLSLIYVCNVYTQEVEKLGEISEIKHKLIQTSESPFGICVNEVEGKIEIMNGNWDGSTEILLNNITQKKEKDDIKSFWADGNIRLDGNIIGFSDTLITLQKQKEIYATVKNISTGISFILKKGEGYIVYYVHEDGTPGAVDTEGKIYSNREALEYLKEYDVEKYEESLVRAEELGLKEDFEEGKVLIWGKTYYTTTNIIGDFYREKDPYVVNGMIQYDNNGYGYQMTFRYNDMDSKLCIVNPKTERERIVSIKDFSKILTTYEDGENRKYFSSSWYVGYGGNIYYYIAGEEYTEVFRIRRTWGDPDMYSMAINGYTEDNYGEYVKTTLAGMSKSDLRLLRNTIFALYGVHFKSADLSAHFAKEVWYIDEGKSSGEVDLPAHRQKLVEMIQEAERSGAR